MSSSSYKIILPALIIAWIISASGSTAAAATVGVCYGRDGDNLPLPLRVVQLLQSKSIAKVRIFTYDPAMVRPFANSNIQLIIGIPNSQIADLARSASGASDWVKRNIADPLPEVNIVGITVGSEVLTSSPAVSMFLLDAMSNIYSALFSAGLQQRVKVSTPHSMSILGTSFPPSAGEFDPRFSTFLRPLLGFLSQTGSYFMANIYPYYAYRNDMEHISPEFALLKPNDGVTDPVSGLHYWNLFDAQLDALYYALAAYGYRDLEVVVSETGWPTIGEPGETKVVSFGNAAAYNGNLVKHLSNQSGTPFKPGTTTQTYIFEFFNEDLRTGPTANRNWGLFNPDGSPLYPVDLGGGVIQINRTFCVASSGASFIDLQLALDWACGPGHADCGAIQPGGVCYLPDTVGSHASYAFNSYFQSNGLDPSACSFSGAATVTSFDPSYGSCIYRGSLRHGRGFSVRQSLFVPLAAALLFRFCII